MRRAAWIDVRLVYAIGCGIVCGIAFDLVAWVALIVTGAFPLKRHPDDGLHPVQTFVTEHLATMFVCGLLAAIVAAVVLHRRLVRRFLATTNR